MVEQMRIAIQGMSCGGCMRAVERALGQIAGVRVQSVEVGAAVVSYDPTVVDRTTIGRAIDNAGEPQGDHLDGGG